MPKIFQIGFNRCGTRSLFDYFKYNCQNGLKCIHWEGGNLALEIFQNLKINKKLLGKYENYDFYADMEAFIETTKKRLVFYAHVECYQILDTQYPQSKFILNTRNVNNWIESRKIHYGPNVIQFLKDHYQTDNIEQLWTTQWNQHHQQVTEYFKNKNNLLVYDIEKDNGSKIIEFFPELKFKNSDFPQIN